MMCRLKEERRVYVRRLSGTIALRQRHGDLVECECHNHSTTPCRFSLGMRRADWLSWIPQFSPGPVEPGEHGPYWFQVFQEEIRRSFPLDPAQQCRQVASTPPT